MGGGGGHLVGLVDAGRRERQLQVPERHLDVGIGRQANGGAVGVERRSDELPVGVGRAARVGADHRVREAEDLGGEAAAVLGRLPHDQVGSPVPGDGDHVGDGVTGRVAGEDVRSGPPVAVGTGWEGGHRRERGHHLRRQPVPARRTTRVSGRGDLVRERCRRREQHVVAPLAQAVGDRQQRHQVTKPRLGREQHTHKAIVSRPAPACMEAN